MIRIQRVLFKNVQSFGNTLTTFDFEKYKKTIITGVNGSGKSTIEDVVTYALYGRPFRKIKKGGMINRINQSDLYVELYFMIGATQYKIIRGMKPNIFDIYINDVLVPQDSKIKDYQKYLENDILNLNFNTFSQIVILGSSSYVPFMRLPSGVRRGIIEDILDISVFSRMNEIIKVKAKELEQEILNTKKDKELAKKQYNFIYEKYQSNLTSRDQKIKEKEERKDELQSLRSDLELEKSEYNQELKNVNDTLKEKQKKEKLNEIRLEIKHSLNSAKKQNKFLENHDYCANCTSALDDEFKMQKQKTLKDKIEKYSQALQELDQHIKKLDSTITESELIRAGNDRIKTEQNKINLKINEINKELTYIDKDIKSIVSAENEFVSVDELNRLKDQIKETDKKLQAKNYSLDIMKKGIDILKDTGAKTAIIKFYLPLINKTLNENLEKFNFKHMFMFDENFDEHILGKNMDAAEYGSFSDGEKLRIDLALMFTWREIARRKNSADMNILFFDEILDSSMDGEGIENFMEIIEGIDKSVNLLIISHKDQVGDASVFDAHLEAVNVNNFTSYNYN